MKDLIEDIYPVSATQAGILFHTAYRPGSEEYFEQLTCRLKGEVNTTAVKKAWGQVVKRHGVLRTAFVSERVQKPLQVVFKEVKLEWCEEDWRGYSGEEQQKRLENFLSKDRKRGFDVSKAPLMRFSLLRLGERNYQFVWSYHHVLMDGWSSSLVVREFIGFYEGISRGQEVHLKQVRPYKDYIRWLKEQDLMEAEKYWRGALKGFSEPVVLSQVRVKGEESVENRKYRRTLSRELTGAVESFARRNQLTVNTVVQGAWALTLSRCSGREDIVFGATTAGRPAVLGGSVESMVGLFINTLPVRVEVDGGAKVLEWLKELQSQQTKARQYEYAPLIEVQGWSEVARGTPLFESLLVFENYPVDEVLSRREGGEIEIEDVRMEERTNYPLVATVALSSGIRWQISYDADRFEGWWIERMAGHLERLLEEVVKKPEARLSELEMISEAEREQLLEEWNDTRTEYPRDKCIQEMFEEQVERTPESVAVVCGDEQLTYRELNERSNQLGHYLRKLGVGPEVLVGICVERSLEMVVGLLGILKAGGAYVPLDPQYPKERLKFMVEDSRVKVLLTQERSVELLPECAGQVVCLDRDAVNIGKGSKQNCVSLVTDDNAAYVIYTSGSTGQPKGVVIEHRNTVAFLHWVRRVFSPEELSGVLASTSICFDLSVFELFGPLSWGGGVIVIENVLQLPGLPAAGQVTLINTVPSAMTELLRLNAIPASVRTINLAGEALKTTLVQQIYQKTTVEKVHDLYGPSEYTTYSTWALRQSDGPATIGRPISNTSIYILNKNLQSVPLGARGELYIGGNGLARGYLNRPELTGEKFIPNPFGKELGERLYRAGDMGRYLADGNIEFLGRGDYQVKLRGYRIELGEIESMLVEHPMVKENMVLAREDEPGEKRLVGYVVLKEGSSTTSSELKSYLKERLPEYMVPGAFVVLEKMPLTANGKVNRKSLPAPDSGGADAKKYVAPRNEVEELLAGIYQAVLKVEQVGIHDNFFELGGHSLLATRVVSRVRELFEVELPLIWLFESSTVAKLSEKVEELKREGLGLNIPPLIKAERKEEPPLSFVQERLWILDQMEPENLAYHLPSVLWIRGKLNINVLERAIEEIIVRHEVLRTTFQLKGERLVQVIHPAPQVKMEITQLEQKEAGKQKTEVLQLAREQARMPFDMSRGPLLRVKLLRLSAQEHVLLFTLHHIVTDGWSMSVLAREFEQLYEAFLQNKESPLERLPIQYADYAIWQRQWLQEEVLEKQLKYWREQLAGAPEELALPVDTMGEKGVSSGLGRKTIFLPINQVKSLGHFARHQEVTPFIVMITGLVLVLHRWSNQSDIVIGTVVAGRRNEQVEKLVGCFLNFLPLRVRLHPNQGIADLISEVKSMWMGAYAHQDCPFEHVVNAVNPQRKLGRNPLYNVGFLLQNMPVHSLAEKFFKVEFMPADPQGALLDLRFVAQEAESGISLACEYRANLFEAGTIEHLLTSFCRALEMLIERPQSKVMDFKLGDELMVQSRSAQEQKSAQTIAIAATFTAEPVEEILDFWSRELAMPIEVKFAPYNQVFQQLLDPTGLQATNKLGVNVVLIRIEDFQRHKLIETEEIRGQVLDFVAAVKAAADRSVCPYIVGLCPGSPDGQLGCVERKMEDLVAAELNGSKAVCLIKSDEWKQTYLVKEYYDRYSDELGHIPYTPEFYTAMGTVLARKVFALFTLPYKVIAVDCDHTLWTGICAEDGASGITIDPARQALQRFLLDQKEAGQLLCLCSKNNENDVAEVFRTRSEMCLSRADFVAWRINWKAKSENLKSLAEELGLGLDSFIFIDDNPLECAEVEANCPQVLTLQLPQKSEAVSEFLKHLWVFDHLETTETDKRRTQLYQQNSERERFRAESPSLEAFLAGLKLRLQITDVKFEQLPRVAQLTQRTNQFNVTAIRRNEIELERLLKAKELECIVVEVQDRFGDYGLTGAMLFKQEIEAISVDTFLLSCRVFGRGIEHRMVASLGTIAIERGLEFVEVPNRATGKNQLAIDFFKSVQGQYHERADSGVFKLTAKKLRGLVCVPGKSEASRTEQQVSDLRVPVQRINSQTWMRIALELSQVEQIRQALDARKQKTKVQRSREYIAPRTPTEEILAGIWSSILGVESIGITDNFFNLGGHSFLAIQFLSRVRNVFKVELPLKDLFEAPTVAGLSERVEALRHSGTGLATPEIRRVVGRDRPLPLSYAQAQLWLACYLMSDSAGFHMPVVLPIGGPLQVKALERAINEMIRRHEVLRTTYKNSEAGPVQVIHDHQYRELPVADLEGLKEQQREEELKRLITEDAQRLFDLERDPVFRTTLVRLGADRHTILHTVHHIATDFFSQEIWKRETRLLYDAFSEGRESPLTELSIQYADYAMWQRGLFQGEIFEKYMEYWRKQTSGMRLLNLPTDYLRPEEPITPGAGVQEIRIRPALLKELKKLNGGVTSLMVLLTGVAVLINRYSGEEDISISFLLANRTRTETEGLMGFFVNALLFRTEVKGDPTVMELLGKVKETTLGVYAYQDIPWYVAVPADIIKSLKNYYSGQKNIKLRLLKYIARESLKTITVRSLKIITRALLKITTLRSLKIIARELLSKTNFQIAKTIICGSLDDIMLESLIAGHSPEYLDACVRLEMFLVELRPDLVREILKDPKVKELVDLLIEFQIAYGRWDTAYAKFMRDVMKKVQPGRDMDRNRAHVVLNLEPRPDEEVELKERISKQDSAVRAMSFDLKLDISENNLGLRIFATHNRDLFKPETIARILKDLEQVLEEFVRNPAKRISELDIDRYREENSPRVHDQN